MKIKKALRIAGKTLAFRDARVEDAEFIHGLRIDEEKSRHLSKVSGAIDSQRKWLSAYQNRIDEAYFIITSMENQPLGTVRLYGADDDRFCWGSWILKDGAPSNAAIESALMVYDYALNHLGFHSAYFQVHKANLSVCKFHERFGAVRVDEDDVQYHYTLSQEVILSSMNRYKRYLNDGIVVQRSTDDSIS
jgi:RimJ/RimL family protein N-acetyltransferase